MAADRGGRGSGGDDEIRAGGSEEDPLSRFERRVARYEELERALDEGTRGRRERGRPRRETGTRGDRAADEDAAAVDAEPPGEETAARAAAVSGAARHREAATRSARAAPVSRRREREDRSETGARVRAALPAIVFAIAIVWLGGLWFAIGLMVLGVLALHELYQLMRRAHPVDIAGFAALAAILGGALLGGRDGMLLALALAVPLAFLFALARPVRENVAWGVAATLLGVLWIGLALGHAVLLRELNHGGALVADVLIGTFVGDTAAYFGGRAWGRRLLAPGISPNKTVAGLVSGIVGGTLAFWGFAVSYQDFFPGADALLIGFCVAVAAPLGDLFESLVKRDLEAKDTGRFFGAHGGVLDRLDAAFFSIIVGYYVSLAVGF